MAQVTLFQEIPEMRVENDFLLVGGAKTIADVIGGLTQRVYQSRDTGEWFRATSVHALDGDGAPTTLWGLRSGFTENLDWNLPFLRGYFAAVHGNGPRSQKYGDAVILITYNTTRPEDPSDTDSIDFKLGDTIAVTAASAPCVVCGRPGTGSCSRCKIAAYCDRDCQSKDWSVGGHAETCERVE